MNANETIKRLMTAYGTTDEATLCLQLQRDEGTLRTWRNRDIVPLSVLVEASRATDYSVEWLRGDASAAKPARKKTPMDDRQQEDLTNEEVWLVERYRSLPPLLRRHVESAALLAWLAYQDRQVYHLNESKLGALAKTEQAA